MLGIRCYHCGKKETINRFCENPDFIPISNHKFDNKWAGPGMYLWDNLYNAQDWYNTRADKTTRGICKCMLEIDEEHLLDLTDRGIADSMQSIIEIMEKNEQISATDEVGIKISFISDFMESKAVKIFGDYPNMKGSSFFTKPKKNEPHVAITTKVIYCVKEGNADILTKRELEKSELEEVI
ncbi:MULTISPECIES: hypothetical protein [Enterococcus]|uniref:hypothetical protein n=1 Tax=Enterococcus TaxID=1350 RepID=UPI0023038F43|nr:hypothetical protein [Enterococcus mundtii]MDA9429946.1 hypothetical protein [Enterococcus mundtii 1A]